MTIHFSTSYTYLCNLRKFVKNALHMFTNEWKAFIITNDWKYLINQRDSQGTIWTLLSVGVNFHIDLHSLLQYASNIKQGYLKENKHVNMQFTSPYVQVYNLKKQSTGFFLFRLGLYWEILHIKISQWLSTVDCPEFGFLCSGSSARRCWRGIWRAVSCGWRDRRPAVGSRRRHRLWPAGPVAVESPTPSCGVTLSSSVQVPEEENGLHSKVNL